jgi:hypothetical protein
MVSNYLLEANTSAIKIVITSHPKAWRLEAEDDFSLKRS